MAIRLKDRIEANIRQADKVNHNLRLLLDDANDQNILWTYDYDGSENKTITLNAAAVGALSIKGGTLKGPLTLWSLPPRDSKFVTYLQRLSNDTAPETTWTSTNSSDANVLDTNVLGTNGAATLAGFYWSPGYGYTKTFGTDGSSDTWLTYSRLTYRQYGLEYGTGAVQSYYTDYRFPRGGKLTKNYTKYFVTSPSASLGNEDDTPVYVNEDGELDSCYSYVPYYGGTFTGSIYAPSYCVEKDHRYYASYYFARNSCDAGETWTSGSNTYAIANNLSWKRFAEVGCAVPIAATKTDSAGTTSTTYWNSYFNFRIYSMNSSTGEFLDYYHEFRTPSTFTNLTTSYTYYLTASSSLTRGSANQPVYLSNGYLYAGNTFVPNTGGTFTGNIAISGQYYPSFELTPTTANSTTSTYPKAVFEGSVYDNVSMWIWGDKTNSAISRRGLVLYNYSAQSDPKKALALRQCDTSGNWQSDLYILHSGNYTDYLGSGGSGDYVPLAGGTMTGKLQVNNLIFGYNYGTGGNNVAAFVWDKPGSNYTGMGACGEDDTIYFGACDASGAWNTSYRQKWKFNGSLVVGGGDDACNIVPWTNNYSTIGTESLKWYKIYSTYIYGSTVYGAVWNDYAEYRSQNEELIAGHIAYCDDDGKLKYTTERLQKFEGVVSDTFGFAIGETDECKTPLAVSGRALVYCDPEDHFHSGDCVCAGPDGKAYRMTREEVTMYPDRIVGVVSEIPTYERWGTGNVEVNGRIWIKVK